MKRYLNVEGLTRVWNILKIFLSKNYVRKDDTSWNGTASKAESIPVLTSDPTDPVEGQIWITK